MYVVDRGMLGNIEINSSCIIDVVLRDYGDDVALVAALAECVLVSIAPRAEARGVALFYFFQCRVRCTVLETYNAVWKL